MDEANELLKEEYERSTFLFFIYEFSFEEIDEIAGGWQAGAH